MTEAQRENPSRRLRVFTQSPAEFFDEGLRQIEKRAWRVSRSSTPSSLCALPAGGAGATTGSA